MHKLRVLIADDHEAMRRLLVNILSAQCTVVSAVADGKSLVEAAVALAPDVIVSDVSMPQMSGPQSMKELRAKGHDIPFVLVSIDSRGSEEFIRQGAAAFVDKMDIQDELLFTVRSVSKRNRQKDGPCFADRRLPSEGCLAVSSEDRSVLKPASL